ncbi:Probable calcium-binding protein CML44 [Striga hermonthica]|uniref:Probable calcium-binding protein CML44 n=1 Tax=Striga hermonthica TaxID=68872 RepID=A0A9N7MLX1_STRHE|nr:Probable calcium-binding protein CML44 [Striga hermonthica]
MPPISSGDLHRIFKNLDKNNNGHVSIQELHRLLGHVGARTTPEELESYAGRKTLDFVDFLFFYEAATAEPSKSKTTERRHENELFEAFKVFDLNGDGYISSEELESVLSRLGLWDPKTGKDGKDMIGTYDENSDGVLDFGEFKNMMSNASSSETEI